MLTRSLGYGGSDGDRSDTSITTGSVIYLPTLPINPETGEVECLSVATRIARKLTPEQKAEIRVHASNRSLRELGAIYGVSHETVRTVLRSTPDEAMAAD